VFSIGCIIAILARLTWMFAPGPLVDVFKVSERRRENPSWPERILAVIQLGYVPLLVAVWLS